MVGKFIFFLSYIDPGSGFVISSLWGWLTGFLIASLGILTFFFKKIYLFMKKYRKMSMAIFIIMISLLIIGVFMGTKKPSLNRKVILLGFDGLSPEIIEPMMQEGKLPNFSLLKQLGAYRHLATTNPSQSPVAWASFATGQNPGKSGIFDFIVRDPKTYGLNLSLSNINNGKPRRVFKSKCFWQYTSQEKIPTVIINCPLTFPPDKVYGKMLSGMGVPDILGTEGTFTFYTSAAQGGNKDIGGRVFQINKSPVMLLNFIGPKVAGFGTKADNVKVSFKVTLKNSDTISIEYQNNKFELKNGERSDWKEVIFRIGLLKEMKGIFKLRLLEVEPEFKLYISPVNFDPREPFFAIAYPKEYSRELVDSIGLYHTQGMPFDTWAVNENRLDENALLEQIEEVYKEKKAMLDFELARLKEGVLFSYFECPDIIQHMFWRYRDTDHPLYNKDVQSDYKSEIQSWYKKMDNVLGDVLRKMDKKDVLIVLSDHGFGTFRRAVHINSWLRKNGYLELKNPNAKSGGDLLKEIDWSKTKAYAIGFGAIYINQEGRERQGIVKPGRDVEFLKTEISQGLKQWIDEKYKKPVINNIYKKEDIFFGKYADEAPDLYIGFNIGYRASWQTALGAVPGVLIEDNTKKWSGDHLFDPKLIPGVLFFNQNITKANPSIYDITPTILKLCGFDEKKIKKLGFDGESLF